MNQSISLLRSNVHHLYWDIFYFGVLAGSSIAFLSVYAARAGASGFQISLLTAAPAVINLLFSLPAGRGLEERNHPDGGNPDHIARSTFWSAFLFRLGYLAIIGVPWLATTGFDIWGLVVVTILMSIPGTWLAIAFNALFADVVPPEYRSNIVGRRNALMAFSLSGTTLLAGQVLDRVPIYPLNYQIVFAMGALGAMLSTYHLSRIHLGEEPPHRIGRPLGDFARPGLMRFADAFRLAVGLRFLARSRGKPLLRLDLLRSPFGRFLAAYLVFYVAQFMPVPLFPLAYVRSLGLTDGQISLGGALFYLTMLAISLRMGHLTVQYGHKTLLVLGSIGYALYPFLLGMATSAILFWVASFFGGMIWGIASAALVNRLMEVAPEKERPAAMALHNLVLNMGMLAGALFAPLMGDLLGIQEALLAAAGLRMLAGLFLAYWA